MKYALFFLIFGLKKSCEWQKNDSVIIYSWKKKYIYEFNREK